MHTSPLICYFSYVQIRVGFILNIICLLVLTVSINTLGLAMFDLHTLPQWANITIAAV